MVTGVRGTSVDIIKDKVTAEYAMTVTDTVTPTNTLKNSISSFFHLKDGTTGHTLPNSLF